MSQNTGNKRSTSSTPETFSGKKRCPSGQNTSSSQRTQSPNRSTSTPDESSTKLKIPRKKLNPEDDGKRKVTLMKRLNKLRSLGQKIEVTLDEKDQPEGNELLSYIGVLAREHVRITIKDWRDEELEETKERIWIDVGEGFVVPDKFKKACLCRVGESARQFRQDLYDSFVIPNSESSTILDRPESVKKFYTSITDKDWNEFVKCRRSDEFKKKSGVYKQKFYTFSPQRPAK